LQQRPRFIQQDVNVFVLFVGHAYHTQCRAPTDRGQRAGVAMMQNGGSLFNQGRAVFGQPLVDFDILIGQPLGLGQNSPPHLIDVVDGFNRGHPQHSLNGPEEVDRRRASGPQYSRRFFQITQQCRPIVGLALVGGQGQTEGRRRPNSRGTPDVHLPNGRGHLPVIIKRNHLKHARQLALVDHF